MKFCEESISYQNSIMADGVGVSFDCAWAHTRNAYQHTAVIIHSVNNKVVASSILSKDYRGNSGNYKNDGAPNMMEINALRSMKDSLLDLRIKYFTLDRDIKIHKFINELEREPYNTKHNEITEKHKLKKPKKI